MLVVALCAERGATSLLYATCYADLHHKTPANDNQLTIFPLFATDKSTCSDFRVPQIDRD